jgi:hypothetical protein
MPFLFESIYVLYCTWMPESSTCTQVPCSSMANITLRYFDPPLFNHAKADAPPTGFADRGFALPVLSPGFSPDTLLFICGASSSPFLLPSSKKRDWLFAGVDVDADTVRVPALEGLNTFMPVSRGL